MGLPIVGRPTRSSTSSACGPVSPTAVSEPASPTCSSPRGTSSTSSIMMKRLRWSSNLSIWPASISSSSPDSPANGVPNRRSSPLPAFGALPALVFSPLPAGLRRWGESSSPSRHTVRSPWMRPCAFSTRFQAPVLGNRSFTVLVTIPLNQRKRSAPRTATRRIQPRSWIAAP